MDKTKYYAVARGRKTGIFKSWSEASSHVLKFSYAKYKSFPSYEQAL